MEPWAVSPLEQDGTHAFALNLLGNLTFFSLTNKV